MRPSMPQGLCSRIGKADEATSEPTNGTLLRYGTRRRIGVRPLPTSGIAQGTAATRRLTPVKLDGSTVCVAPRHETSLLSTVTAPLNSGTSPPTPATATPPRRGVIEPDPP